MSSSPKRARAAVFLLLLVLAAGTRFWGLGWGLPHTYHVDENWFAGKAAQFLQGDLNPRFFHVPTLHMYTLAGLWKAYFLIEKAGGRVGTTAEFAETYIQAPTVFYRIGRALSALFGIGTVLLLFLLGERMYGMRTGAIAALLLVFALDHVRISHDMLPDIPMVFFLVLTLVFVWNILQKGRTRDYLLAGLAAGLAMTTKYGGHMMLLPLFLAHLFRTLDEKRPKWEILFSPRLIGAGLVFLAVFIAGTPYAVLDFPRFYGEFKWQSEHLLTEGHFGSSSQQPALFFYLQHGFRENTGPAAQFLVLGGLLLGLARRKRRDILLLLYPVVLFVLIATWKARATRYLLPLAPFFILIGAVFLDWILIRMKALVAGAGAPRWKNAAFTAAAGLLSAAVLVPSVLPVVRLNAALSGLDSRTRAKAWIDFNIAPGARLALEMYGPPISREKYSVLYRHTLSQTDLDFLAFDGVEYAVISDTMSGRFTRFPLDYPRETAFYEELERVGVRVKTIKPLFRSPLLEIHFPTLKIYRLGRAPAFGFPVNFRSFSQDARLSRRPGGGWDLRTSIAVEGGLEAGEIVRNPYVRVVDASNREIGRLLLFEGDLPTEGNRQFEAAGEIPLLPEGAAVVFGYEYAPSPNSLQAATEEPMVKEHRLGAGVDRAALEAGRWSGLLLFAAVPGPGGPHFRIVTLVPEDGATRLEGRVFGPSLRYGGAEIADPHVLILGADGTEIAKLDLHPGVIGSSESMEPGPVRKSMLLPGLEPGFRIFIGHADGGERAQPGLSPGPFRLEMLPPRVRQGGRPGL